MVIKNGLLLASVSHIRIRPKRNAFTYSVYYLSFALSDLVQFKNVFLLGLNRWNLFSFNTKDHGKRDGSSIEAWIKSALTQWNILEADGDIELVTMPSIFGYVFNPVSFWFCLDKDRNVRAVLSEVKNTFGEHHSYICFHEDRRPIETNDWLRAEKIFYVSPFIEVRGYYMFRFAFGADKIGVWINYHDENGLLLTTSMVGKRLPLTSANLAYYFFRYPMVTLKVIGLIHFQAVKLVLKGLRFLHRPSPPTQEVSR